MAILCRYVSIVCEMYKSCVGGQHMDDVGVMGRYVCIMDEWVHACMRYVTLSKCW
jgi:hypothetical protein